MAGFAIQRTGSRKTILDIKINMLAPSPYAYVTNIDQKGPKRDLSKSRLGYAVNCRLYQTRRDSVATYASPDGASDRTWLVTNVALSAHSYFPKFESIAITQNTAESSLVTKTINCFRSGGSKLTLAVARSHRQRSL